MFNAAKCMEQAALICKELGELMEIARLGEEACILYQQHGTCDSGAMCLEKAAKMIETQHPERAIDLYRRGMDVVIVSEPNALVLMSLRKDLDVTLVWT